VAKAFQRVLRVMTPEGQGPPKHSIDDLRHTFATTLLAKGVPITDVAAQMGHANPATTLRFYVRWLPKEGCRYVELLLGSSAEVPQAVPAPESVTS
jgi:integrase